MSEVRIGTSGWMYDGWRGALYPQQLPKRCWLAYYAAQFSTAEINSAFYRTPSLDAVRAWRNDSFHHRSKPAGGILLQARPAPAPARAVMLPPKLGI